MEELEQNKEEWNEIYQKNASTSHYLSYDFVYLWYDCFLGKNKLKIYKIVKNNITIGFLPLVLIHDRFTRILKSLTNYHCMHSGPIILNGYEKIFYERILTVLKRDTKSWDVCHIEYLYSFLRNKSPFIDNATKIFTGRLKLIEFPNDSIILKGTFQHYISKLSKNICKHYKQSRRRLDHAGKFVIKHYEGLEAKEHWSEVIRIEDLGWKGEQGTSLRKISDSYQKYYKGLIDLLSKKGTLRISLLELNNKNIACQMAYLEDNVCHICKIGYDPCFSNISPSNFLTISVIRNIFENNTDIKTINYFSGDYGFKKRFCNEKSICSNIIIYNKTMRGNFAFLLKNTKEKLLTYKFISRIKNRIFS